MQAFYQFLARVDPWCELTTIFRKKVGQEAFERLLAMGLVAPGEPATLYPCGDGRSCKRRVIENPLSSLKLPPFTAVCGHGPEDGCEHELLEATDLETHQVLPQRLAEVLQRRLGARGKLLLPEYGAWSLGTVGRPARDVFAALRPSSWRPAIRWFEMFLMERKAAPRATLVVVPTATSVSEPVARQHGPGEKVEIVYLEDVRPTLDGEGVIYVPRGPAGTHRVSDSAASALPIFAPPPRGWRDLHLHLVDGETILARTAHRRRRRTYAELGMASKQTGRPTKQWKLLLEVCENNGCLRRATERREQLATQLGYLRERLQQAFGIEDDPFHPYDKDLGWRAKFGAHDTEPDEREEHIIAELARRTGDLPANDRSASRGQKRPT